MKNHLLHRPLRRPSCLAAALASPLPATAADVAGVRFDDKASLAGSELVLNGAALRTCFMLKIYAIGLYLPRRGGAAEAVMASSGPKRIQITTAARTRREQFATPSSTASVKNHGRRAGPAPGPHR